MAPFDMGVGVSIGVNCWLLVSGPKTDFLIFKFCFQILFLNFEFKFCIQILHSNPSTLPLFYPYILVSYYCKRITKIIFPVIQLPNNNMVQK